jgi:hypothetical protein
MSFASLYSSHALASRRAWQTALGFMIVGGCWVRFEVADAKGLVSFPTKSHIVSILHEVQISERAKEPQACSFLSQPIIHVWRTFEDELAKMSRFPVHYSERSSKNRILANLFRGL